MGKKKIDSVGGSGRGQKAVARIDDPNRPDCPVCGGFMRSDGKKQWECNDAACGKKLGKAPQRSVEDFTKQWGFDIGAAEKYAQKCQKYKRLIVTSAQNNTPLFQPFWKALNQASKHFNCPIAVVPVHYKNVSAWNKGDKKEWPSEVAPYLVKGDIQFNNVYVKSDIKIAATSVNPLSGKQAIGGNHWVVFGHAQVGMEPVATPGTMLPKRLYTTGSVSMENYTISNDGEKARFHHTMGALLIEKCGDKCFIRQLNCDDLGHFYDLDVKFTQTGWTKGHRALSLTTGDEHVKFNKVEKETYSGRASIVAKLSPQYIVRHDVLDGYAGSHHHEADPLLQFAKHHSGDNDYRAELDQAVEFINRTTPKDSKTLIVPSNHHDHLYKWLSKADANKDHTNAILICELQKAMREAVLNNQNPDPFYLYAKERLTCDFEFLDRNEPYIIGEVDHAQHGDVGVNGSRGSAVALAKSTFKMTVGHSHSARINKGVFQVGTSTGKLEYERGLSTHSTTHCLQYQNGKRTHIDIIEGKWRA